jgi:hypothetical protein
MRRTILTLTLATAGLLVAAEAAQAQIRAPIQSRWMNPWSPYGTVGVTTLWNGGIGNQAWGANPWTGTQFYQSRYVNPWTGGVAAQQFGINPWTGGVAAQQFGINPWTGTWSSHNFGIDPWTGTQGVSDFRYNPLINQYRFRYMINNPYLLFP